MRLDLIEVKPKNHKIKIVVIVIISILFIVLFSMFIAVVLNQKFKGRGMARVLFFLPVIIASGISIQILSANGMSTDINKTSSLLFGIQWDLTCKFLEENSILTKTYIKSDSTSWGNYKNNSLTLYRGKYNISPSSSTSTWTAYTTNTTNYITSSKTSNNESYYQLLTTGASEQTNKLNIYDFAGNEWEWTLEHATSDTDYPCVHRGGRCKNNGSDHPASSRSYIYTTNSNDGIGFRSALY